MDWLKFYSGWNTKDMYCQTFAQWLRWNDVFFLRYKAHRLYLTEFKFLMMEMSQDVVSCYPVNSYITKGIHIRWDEALKVRLWSCWLSFQYEIDKHWSWFILQPFFLNQNWIAKVSLKLFLNSIARASKTSGQWQWLDHDSFIHWHGISKPVNWKCGCCFTSGILTLLINSSFYVWAYTRGIPGMHLYLEIYQGYIWLSLLQAIPWIYWIHVCALLLYLFCFWDVPYLVWAGQRYP